MGRRDTSRCVLLRSKTLSTLATIVAEFGDCHRKRRLSPNSAYGVHGLGGPPGEDECTDATELMTELDEDEVEEDVGYLVEQQQRKGL